MKYVFVFLTEPLGLPIAWYWEWLILGAIGFIAYAVAFAFVGDMYDEGAISGRGAGSFFHWLIRLGIFAVLWVIVYGIIALVKCIIDNWIIVLAIFGGLLIVGAVIAVIFWLTHKKKGVQAENARDEK